jgi:murein DD-endopeptidase MepM/ murein hydrolase activator NlpD
MYNIQRGDTLEGIRKDFGLGDPCTLIWSNDRNKVSPLRPGAEILVPPVDGVYFKIRETMTIKQLAELTTVDPFAIIDSPYNADLFDATPDSLLVEGLQIMVPGGNGGNCNIWEAGPTVAGGSSGSGGTAGVSGSYSLWGCNASVQGGGFPATNPLGGSRYTFFQGFSGAHTGVDLSADSGTPVGAAGLGTVVFAGWNSYGYGNTVVIAHGTTFTLYGHLSSIGVRCGQSVSAGQTIGGVGSTGRSSGPHLHFEIRDAGFNAMDPVYTIGF